MSKAIGRAGYARESAAPGVNISGNGYGGDLGQSVSA